MRAAADGDRGAGRPPSPLRPLLREAARAAAAFALYLLMHPVWTRSGAHDAYAALVLTPARAAAGRAQHFPVRPALENLSLSYLDFLILLTLCYLVVSNRMGWATRLRRFAALLSAIYVTHILAVALEIQIDFSGVVSARDEINLLLPWEQRILEAFKYLLVNLGMQVGPFLVMVLAAVWNSGLALVGIAGTPVGEGRRAAAGTGRATPRRGEALRRDAATLLAVMLLGGLAAAAWRSAREADPRHQRTHVRMGDRFRGEGRSDLAEQQYRAAIEPGCTDGRPWYQLAGLLEERGDRAASARVLREGLKLVNDPQWRGRIEAALAGRRGPPG